MRFLPLLFLTATLHAQWTLQTSNTTADLRGIHSLGDGVAWASGTNGTVLHTTDNGAHWLLCTVPPGAEKLDFRGIQAFDANTAIVMSSGKGDLSRLYKTTDGCQTWKLILTNPEPEGFWDTIHFGSPEAGELLGDPVDGIFAYYEVYPGGPVPIQWKAPYTRYDRMNLEANGRGAFAASNSSLAVKPPGRPLKCISSTMWIGTSGPNGAKIFRQEVDATEGKPNANKKPPHGFPFCSDDISMRWLSADVPISGATSTAGVFSIAAISDLVVVAVGGDYQKLDDPTHTAAFTINGGKTWQAAVTTPHGYRSAVAYDATTKTWITVGPNGTDISTDDGRNWRALKPGLGDAPDADQHWNALSLPFVVGPHGHIGLLNPTALTTSH
jgi:photosystem II stability/assembly factor-like uncharacterized protein